ncbi:hypothetical protein ANN_27720, partial [Periplaneta americana]
LDLQAYDNTYEIEDNKASSKQGNLSHLEVTSMKTECVDNSYNIKSEIKVEDTSVPTSFSVVKSEVDEGNLSYLEVTGMKIECVDHKYDIKSEEDFFYLDGVQQEQEVRVSSEENEVFPESIMDNVEESVSQEHAIIDCEKDKLAHSGSFADSGNLKYHKLLHRDERPFKCEVCGKSFIASWSLKKHKRLHTDERPFKCEIGIFIETVIDNLFGIDIIRQELFKIVPPQHD